MIFIKATQKDFKRIVDLARSLPEWFTSDGISQIEKDLPCQHSLLAELNGNLVGFLSFYSYEGVAHIGWMGVDKRYQRIGIGSELINTLVDFLLGLSIFEVRVKTLGESILYEPYVGTRLFYYARGFLKFRTSYSDNPEFSEELELRLLFD
jgi:ribosomal protein S18 acetylase RimI-like enzyme